ncbi:type I-F CRISPR-associated endoribonuclease Cas6/Csy4 [Marinobacterium jannaschii]|uniref:type I-F CRISPR-associated endoribonuclease Cas6/Csy4 n=1 Tax=Marinobacterium jannaschii TaxID=64970 RepID=UPI000481AE7F|nr:type I-F CRISPR-associated endoribonuclease Cas6/Csy4 [Marinobacterium jannaschii]
MLSHYLEISILPDPEFSTPMLMNALLCKLHRALVSQPEVEVALSFPGYSRDPRSLGDRLRLHGSADALDQLGNSWLRGMADHINSTGIEPIPQTASYCTVRRRQFKSSAERLRRRRMKRHGESYEQAAALIPDSVERKSQLPFATLRSTSSGQQFQLFIEQSEATAEPKDGTFNRYGLSQQATVPWF